MYQELVNHFADDENEDDDDNDTHYMYKWSQQFDILVTWK